MRNSEIERVAETHYFIRHVLKRALTNYELTSGAKETFPGCSTYWDIWTQRFSQKFFDMGTLIRAAASVETFLRDYYAYKKGYQNLSQLRQDRKYKKNIFQRTMPWHKKNGAIPLLLDVGVDLEKLSDFPTIQELMLHRHLYAHNLGVIDDSYIEDLKNLTGTDLLDKPEISSKYPAEDVYWFEPLGRINLYIEAVRRFCNELT
jgi:hypothetical protein|uniref:RiboL-PSP-HEPN domain-containing protein n=2 Tax=Meiothermus ruber TaxID=277 RepID=A0A7C3DI50_MEIRU